jgi:hypothetical protein
MLMSSIFPYDNMLIILWQGDGPRHTTEHVASASEVNVNMITISNFF